MYKELFEKFENVENLGGKAWQHSLNLDLIEKTQIKDCSLHCFFLVPTRQRGNAVTTRQRRVATCKHGTLARPDSVPTLARGNQKNQKTKHIPLSLKIRLALTLRQRSDFIYSLYSLLIIKSPQIIKHSSNRFKYSCTSFRKLLPFRTSLLLLMFPFSYVFLINLISTLHLSISF